eukprot:TRINITY_DN1485_c0_g1_i2.p1 TRINITY_DN1485_c0_g1~~TRINITY_DN1485_c0_g1_i2.p1  ORF type:complete len:469 (-),score=136.77 TRINITY_DN1485_c0_g1_i2:132-1505(-)
MSQGTHLAILLVIGLIACAAAAEFKKFKQSQPEQIQVFLTGKHDEMVVSWITPDDTNTSTVLFGTASGSYNRVAYGQDHHYSFLFYTSGAIHVVTLRNLTLGTKYYYICGDKISGFSSEFYFYTEPATPPTPSQSLRIALMADMGVSNNSQNVLNAMLKADAQKRFSFLAFAGDLSYANGFNSIWDDWGRLIQPATSHMPWMFAVGNHELFDLYKSFQERFELPNNGPKGNLFYSFDYQNVHLIALNSETLNMFSFGTQFKWLESDLQSVDRKKTPWLFVMFHTPWYCSNKRHENSGWFMRGQYEELFYKYGVDMVFQGHVHAYERTKPVYGGNVTPDAPVFVTNGHGGNKEGLYNSWTDPTPAWSAYRAALYGFSTIEIFNATHLHYQMIATDSKVMDDAWVIRSRSKTFPRAAVPKLFTVPSGDVVLADSEEGKAIAMAMAKGNGNANGNPISLN